MAAEGHHGSNRDHYHRQYDHELRPQVEHRGPPQDSRAPGWSETRIAAGWGGSDGGGAAIWHPRSYSCSFCKREFRSAQALGGHMNVHRRDRARLREISPPTTSSSSNNSSATHSTAIHVPDHQEHHSSFNINPSAPLPPPQCPNTRPPHVSPPGGIDSYNQYGTALSSSPTRSTSSVGNLSASSSLFKPVLQPNRIRNYDYGAAQTSAAAYNSSSSSAHLGTCVQLMSSCPAVMMDTVLLSTRKISPLDDQISSLSPAVRRDHYRSPEADAASELLQLPPTIATCKPHSSLPGELKREIFWKSSAATGFQPYQQLQARPEFNKLGFHEIAQSVNAVDETLILSPVAGLDLDLELRLGQRL